MKLKKEYIVLIIVIVGLVLYLTMRSANHAPEELPQPATVDKVKIDKLVVSVRKNEPIELVRKDEKWLVEPKGYPASDIKVKNMVNAVADLKLTALVSESKNYDRYDLTPQSKISVTAYADGKEIRQFNIGKAAPTFQHTFVQLLNDPNVYHARGQLVRTFDYTVDTIRDKNIFDLDNALVSAITLEKGDASVSLTKKEIAKEEQAGEDTKEDAGQESKQKDAESSDTPTEPPEIQWQDADGNVVDKAGIDQLMGAIARMDCDGYLADDAQKDLTDPLFVISFKDDQREYTLSVYPAKDEKADSFSATASTTPYAFELKKGLIERIEKPLNKLLGIETPEKMEEKAQALPHTSTR